MKGWPIRCTCNNPVLQNLLRAIESASDRDAYVYVAGTK